MFLLECEMNLLIYGVGSKYLLIEEFMKKHLHQEYPISLVRGYHSGLAPKQILTDIDKYIHTEINCMDGRFYKRNWTSTMEILEYIECKLNSVKDCDDSDVKPCVILIHSMDIRILKR